MSKNFSSTSMDHTKYLSFNSWSFDQIATHNEVLCFALSPQNPIPMYKNITLCPYKNPPPFKFLFAFKKKSPSSPPPTKNKNTPKIPLNFPKLNQTKFPTPSPTIIPFFPTKKPSFPQNFSHII
jgi:hypothetical protein